MVNRKDAIKLVQRQLDNSMNKVNKYGQWHYGLQELRELLDLIYEGKPNNKNEELNSNHRGY